MDNLVSIINDTPPAALAAGGIGILGAATALALKARKSYLAAKISRKIIKYQSNPASYKDPEESIRIYELTTKSAWALPKNDHKRLDEFLNGIEARFTGTETEPSHIEQSRWYHHRREEAQKELEREEKREHHCNFPPYTGLER